MIIKWPESNMRIQSFIMQFISHRAMIILMIGLPFVGCFLSAERQAKLQELRQLAAETPKFPDFEQVDYSDISKSDNAVVNYFYQSSASYEEVKSFYTTTLLSRGWNSAQEEPIANWLDDVGRRQIFRKRETMLFI